MNEEAAFLRAICESPDDDTPRLVFADWLQEQGGPVNTAWAGGIRAQVWLARGANDDALRFQACVFESPFGQRKVLERLGVSLDHVGGWDRGFPSELVGPFDLIRDLWPKLVGRAPVRRLLIHDTAAEQVAGFATWPGLSALRELTFGAAWEAQTFDDPLPPLAACADLRGLTALRVEGGHFSDAGMNAILDSPHLAGLKTCTLVYGYGPSVVSTAVRDRFEARFGPGSYNTDEIPF